MQEAVDWFERGRSNQRFTRPASNTSCAMKDSRLRRFRCVSGLAAATVGGLVVLDCELIWTLLFSLPMRSISYSFSPMLAYRTLGPWLLSPLTENRLYSPHALRREMAS